MKIFDVYIEKMADYIVYMQSMERQVRTFQAPAFLEQMKDGLSVRVGPGANQGIILRGDTYLELGNPEVGSCAFTLFTDNSSLIADGRITLIGPDVNESEGKSLPFGQVLMIGGRELAAKDYEALRYAGFIGDQIEGYMVRSLIQNIWSRVSKDAAAKGFNFENLGQALMAIYKSGNTKIEAMETIFVTSGNDDIKILDDIAVQVQKITKEIVKENWKIKGYDIDCARDCNVCNDKEVCDDIREAVKGRI